MFKKAVSITMIISFVGFSVFNIFEPVGTQAQAQTDMVGVTAQVNEEISITSPSDLIMTPSISGMTGNLGVPASGSVSWTVKTANATGFNMKIKASTDPAMQLDGAFQFADYTPAVIGSPDINWQSPIVGEAEFGFSVLGGTAADVETLFLNDGAGCMAGANNDAKKCWFDFNGTNNIDIINRSTNTTSAGEVETVYFNAESNAKFLKEGNYDAYITVTAAMN